MKKLLSLFVAALLLVTDGAGALVNPESTALPVQGWLVDIHVVDADDTLHFFCRGALIDKRWVLTAATCLYDPYKALDDDGSESEPKFVVMPGGSSETIEVTRFVQSDDFRLGMMHLAEDAPVEPVRLSSRTEAALIGADVYILGKERTPAIGHSYFNPVDGAAVYCNVSSALFITGNSTNGGAICYVHARPQAGTTLFMTRARVLDPSAPGSPNSYLDTVYPFDRHGTRLYLDFRVANSYPCHEDLGSPILATAADGAREVVGVVTGVGMASALPMCNQTLLNVFASAAHHQQFIEETISEHAFASLCPAQPELEIEGVDPASIRLHWKKVPGASGYKLHYTPREGYTPIRTVDMKEALEISTPLKPDVVYTVAVSAYNANCSGEVSERLSVSL